jgi:hypothetical protein
MKKILLLMVFLCSTIFAEVEDWDNYQWPRTYFASIGFSVIANRGDFFDHTAKIKTDKVPEHTISFPITKVLVSPDYNIGVNIREFTLAGSFQYWSMTGTIGNDYPENFNEQKMRYWRFGAEFTYNFFYPDVFQVGVGLGYSFTSIKTNKSAFDGKDYSDAEVMGSGIALVTNMKYFITEHFGLCPSLRIYENWFKAANTKATGTQDFNSYLWQTYIAVSINAIVQF